MPAVPQHFDLPELPQVFECVVSHDVVCQQLECIVEHVIRSPEDSEWVPQPPEEVAWWITLLIIVVILVGVSFLSTVYDYVGLRYRQVRARSQLVQFDDMMTRIGKGTVVGTPLAPNEQVLRAVCKCEIAAKMCRDFYRVSSVSPIEFECDATTGSHNRMPPTPSISLSTYEISSEATHVI